MKIAFVCDWLTNYSGAEAVLKALCELYPHAPIYTTVYNKEKVGDHFSEYDVRTSYMQKWPGAQTGWQKYILFMPQACESFDLSDYDVVISSNHTGCSKGVITKADATHISYCHSPMRTVWDDYHEYLRHSSWPALLKRVIPFFLHKLRMWDYCASARVDHFIANSSFISQRISKYYDRTSTVIHPPVDVERFCLPEKAFVGDYYLIAARLVPNKNVEMAVRAVAGSNIKLKIAGKGPLLEYLQSIATPNVEFLGYVSDEDLLPLMQQCRGFLYPQIEDFGISAVEAMACGRPVVAYKGGGALDTVKHLETGILFDTYSSQGMLDAILMCEKHMSTWDSKILRLHAETFSKQRFQKEFQEFVHSLEL